MGRGGEASQASKYEDRAVPRAIHPNLSLYMPLSDTPNSRCRLSRPYRTIQDWTDGTFDHSDRDLDQERADTFAVDRDDAAPDNNNGGDDDEEEVVIR